MGAADSKQRLGERVLAARKKLAEDINVHNKRVQHIQSKSPETIQVCIDSIAASFESHAPFLEPTLLVAWQSNPEKCASIILSSCKKVLEAPINPSEYNWFRQYVFPSSIWMFKTNDNMYMYERLIGIVNIMSSDIITSMDGIYAHLQSHPKWKVLKVLIKNQTLIGRQDNEKVGLLREKGIRNVLNATKEEKENDELLQSFVDSNLGVNILVATAKKINEEFQHYVESVMSQFGDFKPGPIKKVERCASKLENDYQDAEFPKCAKLLDLVRCSVTFNTIDQLINGYNGLVNNMRHNPKIIELARVKNGFLDKDDGGYRDVKINVVYYSQIDKVAMICEIQMLLGQYLHGMISLFNATASENVT